MGDLPLVGFKCKKCGRIHYPYHDRCLNDRTRDFEQVAPQGKAKLLTFTEIFNLPWGFDQRFLSIGIVQFDNGFKAMGQIKVDTEGQLKLGQVLEASWEPVRYVAGEPVYGLMLTP
jgi:uncharacterized OB-fold protein